MGKLKSSGLKSEISSPGKRYLFVAFTSIQISTLSFVYGSVSLQHLLKTTTTLSHNSQPETGKLNLFGLQLPELKYRYIL